MMFICRLLIERATCFMYKANHDMRLAELLIAQCGFVQFTERTGGVG